MTKYINILTNQYPVPENLINRIIEHADKPGYVARYAGKFAPVTEVEPPASDYKTTVKEIQPVFINGEWIQAWKVTEKPAAEAEYIFNKAAADARFKRDTLLTKSDWTQMADSAIADKAPWIKYRSDLRNITAQPGFPFTIVWPTTP